MSARKSLDWLCLSIGNSRLHWAWFKAQKLQLSWNSQYLTKPVANNTIPSAIFPDAFLADKLSQLPVCLASVVPEQTKLWKNYTPLQQITLADIPLPGIYPTMGVDRALAVWGAGKTYGFPCLVIDAGTALTFTGVDDEQKLVGGAILPGLSLQLKALADYTAALPIVKLTSSLPHRWALNTTKAIESGIVYTVLAGINSFITDWTDKFPQSTVIVTGGDALLLAKYWNLYQQTAPKEVIFDTNLLFFGIQLVYFSLIKSN
ncbi:MAG: pantothenate kinase [Xenococcaceae cyanobacterium MO_188.B29]|nr:pantothenate kinase [Xenococcaceae cyanobacterium MO_188.B29]